MSATSGTPVVRIVEVRDYDPRWPDMFRDEAARLQSVFGDELEAVHHIGSTAVPGLKAKPIIDLLLVVRDIRRVDDFYAAMIRLGYEPRGENGIPGRRFFSKGGNRRTHHVHAFQRGDPHIRRHLAFRDYLRAHPEAAEQYGKRKEELARRFPRDIEAYIRGKDGWIKETEQKALAWWETRNMEPTWGKTWTK